MNYTLAWSKAMLYSLRYIKSVCRQIDRAVARRAAVVSGVNPSSSEQYDSTYTQMEKVISFMEKKKKSLRLVTMCREILCAMHLPYRKALVLKYIQNKSDTEIENRLGCCIRTFFRYTSQGLNAFTELRKKYGYSDEYLNGLYSGEPWVIRLKVKAGEEEDARQKIILVKKKSKPIAV